MEQKIIEICKECGKNKVLAIKKVRDEFGYDLVTAKDEVDKAYNEISPVPVQSHKGGIFRRKKTKMELYNESHENEIRFDLHITAGREYIKALDSPYPTLWQKEDGLLYFENDSNHFYSLVDFIWDGPQYNTYSTSRTAGTEKGEQKRKGRMLGAVAGSIVAPGIGTIIGAAHGTGNKKSKKEHASNTITTEQTVEVPSMATLKLQDLENNKIITLILSCTSLLANRLSLVITNNEQNNYETESISAVDPYEEIKKVKELLDMGIITQEEFDAKKKELLGL